MRGAGAGEPERHASDSESLSEILEAVSFPVRLKMLRVLSSTELSYTELMSAVNMRRLGDVGRFTYHLKRLLKTGLIEVSRESKLYRLSRVGRMVLDSIDAMATSMARQEATMVRTSEPSLMPFDKLRISGSLIHEAGLPPRIAYKVAVSVERKLRDLRLESLNSSMIRELVNAELVYMGLERYRDRYARTGLPIHEVSQIIKRASPGMGAPGLLDAAASGVFKEYLLIRGLPRPVSDLCFSGSIDIWGLERWITHLLCLDAGLDEESMEEALTYGLTGLATQEITLVPRGEWRRPDGLRVLVRAKRAVTLNVPGVVCEELKEAGMSGEWARRVLSSVEGLIDLGRLRAAYPLNAYAGLALAPERGSLVLYSTAGAFESRRGGRVLVGGLVGINICKVFLEAGREIDLLGERLREIIRSIRALFYRKRGVLERATHRRGGQTVYFLLAPVGLYEVARCMSREGLIASELEAYQRLLSEVSSEGRAASQSGLGVALASSWPSELSSRVAKRNLEIFGARSISRVLGEGGLIDRYLESVAPADAIMGGELPHRLNELFEGGLMIDIPEERMGEGVEEVLSLLTKCSNVVVRIASAS